jgi:CubicO group peptidase (beta-lactamase class C family)
MDLQDRIERFVAEGDVPGAVLGLLVDGEPHVYAAGVLNRRTGVAVTPDSIFQIGSNTKVWTATQVMQLVDEGAVDLDDPVRTHLPDFRCLDPSTTASLTIRHLLTHTGGIEGDVFDDFGSNDDAVARYVAGLAGTGTVHEPAETWSYCNSGWVVLGRLVEVLRGKTWVTALRETLAEPLGIESLCVTADEAILRSAAVGHVKPPDTDDLEVTSVWSIPRAMAPAGIITTSVGDLMKFARMHLSGGAAPDGTQILSPESARQMRTPQVALPAPEFATHWGLGWIVDLIDETTVISHGGHTIGQSAYFWAVPDRDVAVALLTNASGRDKPSNELVGEVVSEFAGVTLPADPEPSDPDPSRDLARFSGTYARHAFESTIDYRDGELHGILRVSGPLAEVTGLDRPVEFRLEPVADDETLFVAKMPEFGSSWIPFRFYALEDGGRPRFMHSGGRASRRVS